MSIKRLKINKSIKTPTGMKMGGTIINVECDANDVPLDLFWRARLKDSEIDNCVELVKETAKPKIVVEYKEQESVKEEIKINKKKKNK